MYCKYCGSEIANDSSFCKHCGKKVNSRGTWNLNSIKRFFILSKKMKWFLYLIALCSFVTFVCYYYYSSHSIVGSWIRQVEEVTENYYFDKSGGWALTMTSYGFTDTRAKGTWEKEGDTLRLTAVTDRYTKFSYTYGVYVIENISSKELSLKNIENNQVETFAREE